MFKTLKYFVKKLIKDNNKIQSVSIFNFYVKNRKNFW